MLAVYVNKSICSNMLALDTNECVNMAKMLAVYVNKGTYMVKYISIVYQYQQLFLQQFLKIGYSIW